MSRLPLNWSELMANVPRTCGDEPDSGSFTRGFCLMFPAPAGMSPTVGGVVAWPQDVPRTCGDEPHTGAHMTETHECSPHLRG